MFKRLLMLAGLGLPVLALAQEGAAPTTTQLPAPAAAANTAAAGPRVALHTRRATSCSNSIR